MKKITLLFFLFLIFSLFSVKKEEKTELVNLSLFNEYPEKYEIDVQNLSITTKNLTSYFEKNEIFSIVIHLPLLAKQKGISDTYYFESGSIEKNLNRVIEQYRKKLKETGFQKEYYEIFYRGIKIKKVFAELSSERVKQVLRKDSKIVLEPMR